MNAITHSDDPVDFDRARARLVRDSHLHWFHWLAIALSLTITFGAWHVSKQYAEEKLSSQFDRLAVQIVALVSDRMLKYEDALWGGVGAIAAANAAQGEFNEQHWHAFANTLKIDKKYPGISGIGVIYHVQPGELASYLAQQRRTRAQFRVHPAHHENEYLPITFIEPVAPNLQALGLDMAHENNRYTATKKARDSGLAQVTGPIVLVQDAEKMPGFLFFAPFYHSGPTATIEQRRQRFAGMVYAPFVVKKLMQGVLGREHRNVGIRISDNDEVLYDEHHTGETGFDADPLFKRQLKVDLYGRNWRFDIWSDQSFRAAATDTQSATILCGGIVIDLMLIALFMALSRSNRHALAYADHATEQLRHRTARLERSNADLEQFAYIASHDLQEPLRMVGNFSQLLQRHFGAQADEKADKYFGFVLNGVQRMGALLNDLLEYSRIDAERKPAVAVDFASVCECALRNLDTVIRESSAVIEIAALPQVLGDAGQLTRLMQNLLGNAIKFRTQERALHIQVGVTERPDEWCFSVADNGIGMDKRYFDKIFVMFQRLHGRDSFAGTGVGLPICRKIVISHGGTIWTESAVGIGSTFYFTIAKKPPLVSDEAA